MAFRKYFVLGIKLIIQISVLILFSGNFYIAFTGILKIINMIISNSFSLQSLIPFLAPILIALLTPFIWGRFFCGWFCAFGTIQDLIILIRKPFGFSSRKLNSSLDQSLRFIKYFILVAVILLSLSSLKLDPYNPWYAFGRITEINTLLITAPIALISLIIIFFASLFIDRFFCRYLCPLGALIGILSNLKLIKISKNTNNCGKCQICSNNCPMGLDLSEKGNFNPSECITCLNCINSCPRKNINLYIFKTKINEFAFFISGLIFIAAIFLTNKIHNNSENTQNTMTVNSEYDNKTDNNNINTNNDDININNKNNNNNVNDVVNDNNINSYNNTNNKINNNLQDTNNNTNSNTINDKKTTSSNASSNNSNQNNTQYTITPTPQIAAPNTNKKIYKDGTFEGTADGYKSKITVSVSILNDKITDIKVLSHNESRGFFEEPVNKIPKDIISHQSTKVDSVSGATYTSEGIKTAVENALKKALIS